jgi:hypothetical protein
MSRFAVVLVCFLAGSCTFTEDKKPPEGTAVIETPEPFGKTINNLRLNMTADRGVYRLGKDVINFTFTLQNQGERDVPITLQRTGEDLTELILIEETSSKQHIIRRPALPTMGPKSWEAVVPPRKVARVNTLFDPASAKEKLKPGRYRVRGVFRYEIADRTKWKEGDFKLESNEITFTLREPAKDEAWAASKEAGGCTLALQVDQLKWGPGTAPLSFNVILTRLHEGLDTYRLLSVVGLTYYHLEVTDPRGKVWLVNQPVALPSSVSPHFRFTSLSAGSSVGERLSWNPTGKPVERTLELKDYLLSAGPAAPVAGKYKVRAIYQVDAKAEDKFNYGITADRLESNPVEVEIFP